MRTTEQKWNLGWVCCRRENVSQCVLSSLTVVHEAVVAEPHTQRHGVLSVRAVTLGNQISDAHSGSDTKPVYTFTCTADCRPHGSALPGVSYRQMNSFLCVYFNVWTQSAVIPNSSSLTHCTFTTLAAPSLRNPRNCETPAGTFCYFWKEFKSQL